MSLFTTLRNAVTSVAAPLVTAAATVYGGPVLGGLTGTLLAGAGSGPSAPGSPTATGAAIPGAGEEGGGMIRTAGAVRGAVGAMAAARNWLISGRGIVSTISGRLLGVLRGTKLFKNAQVADLAKRIGIEATAAALGITVVEVAQLIAAHLMQRAGRHRRGRGITARDVRTTRRTIHKIRSIEHALSQSGICRHTSRARRAPAAFVRQG